MSLKGSMTTCSGLEWNDMLGLLHHLKRDQKLKEYLVIATGCYLGLRAKDLLSLKWEDLLDKESLTITESKTQKKRHLTINQNLTEILLYVKSRLEEIGRFNREDYLFRNRRGGRYTIQHLNGLLKDTFSHYRVKVQNSSSHTLRKTFGKRVWEMDGKSERSLIYLSEIFSHSSIAITKRYIGIVQQDIQNIYLNL
ncbi:tyrosine-type recombinase/integrase [Pontibacter anaerobius]|uniref:Tyrosine-type recombinase/integrase n=1 Tax=Pontibacter anaerobius TaxID=2993940 RepID=A0ABT3RIL1_9BACT|nr:tyrosine-type recombinase/integrase [Pontibacter anaerobius]MCX2741462.1 tyrosine-type recombinase/integrase [Pontibacter anaerobius]